MNDSILYVRYIIYLYTLPMSGMLQIRQLDTLGKIQHMGVSADFMQIVVKDDRVYHFNRIPKYNIYVCIRMYTCNIYMIYAV